MTDQPSYGYLGQRAAFGALSADNRNVPGGWLAMFSSQDLYPADFLIWHIALKGPTGGFDVYIDDTFYSTASRSDRNEYDPKQPIYMRRGQSLSFHFASTDPAGPVPEVRIFARQPTGLF